MISGTSGAYEIILPSGPYNVTAGTAAHQEQTQAIRVQVGQTFEQNFDLQPGKVSSQVSVSASAELAPEVKSTEVATNVSQQQIESLPQTHAELPELRRPGARRTLSHDELRQEISYGAQGATNTNVFIDGTSFKNDVPWAAPSGRTRAAGTRSRRTPSRSSASSRRTSRPSTRRPRA